MFVDKETLLFHDLNDDEFARLAEMTDRIVFEGTLPSDMMLDSLVRPWLDAGEFGTTQTLLVMSTIFPIRAYRSMLIYMGHD